MSQRIIIVGATSAIAAECAKIWAESGAELVLVARNESKLNELSNDLKARSKSPELISTICTDLIKLEAIESTLKTLTAKPFDVALIAQGLMPNTKLLESDFKLLEETLLINSVSVSLFAQGFANQLEKQSYGNLTILGSIAGDRGRKRNYIYGSAKGQVERLTEGIRQRLFGSKVKVLLVKPGPTFSPMTKELRESGRKVASTDSVARGIVRAIEAGRSVVYLPTKWRFVMAVIKRLPKPIFHRTSF